MNNRSDKRLSSEGILLKQGWVTKKVMWLVDDIMEDDDISRTMVGLRRAAE